MSVSSRVRSGYYYSKLEAPKNRPSAPPLLNKPAKELTAEEMAEAVLLHTQFLADVAAWMAAKDAIHTDNDRLRDQLRIDLEEEFGITGNPRASALWQKAWEQGHSAGYHEVVTVYSNLVDLVR